jgi:RNA polymerase sigma-70 factor (ECF subfamily)
MMHTLLNTMTADRSRHRFATTRWSQVIAAAGVSPTADVALAELCEAYWYPIYAFVRRSGHSVDDASDLTQAFFTRVLEKQYLKDARPDRGRFRSFLLASVRHFLSNERDWRMTLRRGGRQPHIPLDFSTGEHRYQLEPADELTPERVYERRWTLNVLDKAMARLFSKYEEGGREDLFSRLKPYLVGDEPESYRELADALNVSEGSLRVAVHRLRKEYKATLRDAIAETVERDEEVDDELRYLLTVVGRQA